MNNGAESQVDLLDGPELPQSLMVDLVHTGSLLFLILVTRMETSTPNLCFYIDHRSECTPHPHHLDCYTRSLSVTRSVSISSASYSATLSVSAGGSASWTFTEYLNNRN